MARRGQNEGSIYERNDGRWCATVNLGWVNGKRLRKSYYGETRKDVQEQLTKALSDRQKGLPLVMEKQSVADYLRWWLESVAKGTVRPSTWTSYEELVRLHLRPAFEKVSLSKLSPQQVRSFLGEKLTGGLSARRVQYLHAVLRAALNTAVKDQLTIRNVAAIVKPPRVTGKEVQPLTPVEARRFLGSIRGNRLEALFTVAISVGLRQGEALGLRWRDVDFEAGTLRIRYALQRIRAHKNTTKTTLADRGEFENGDSSGFHLVEPKTKQSRRTIALPKLTLSALAEHKARLAQERSLAGTAWHAPIVYCDGEKITVEDFVFVTRFGTHSTRLR